MTRTRHLAITALAVARGGVAMGQATQDDPQVAAPAQRPAPLSADECQRLLGDPPPPDENGIVYRGECNYGEATITP